MARLEETNRTIDFITNSYPVKTQEYLMLKEIARSIAVIADNMPEPVKPFMVHKDESSIYPRNFAIDWEAGYEASNEDIKDFCQEEIKRSEHNDDMRDMYYTGYRYGLCKVLEFIERMGTDEGN